ncbi:hypothetical protein MF669_002809, partial [Clostridium perfringens]|nr:hypothetical protein [Clostridium perfringens]
SQHKKVAAPPVIPASDINILTVQAAKLTPLISGFSIFIPHLFNLFIIFI